MTMLLMMLLCADEPRGQILPHLTADEQKLLNSLDEPQRLLVSVTLAGQSIKRRNGMDNINKGEMFVTRGGIRISQVVDETNAIVHGAKLWMSNYPTANFSDGDVGTIDNMVWYCTGNKQYTTAIGGTNTVMHLRRMDLSECLDVIKPIAEGHGFRVWGIGTDKLAIAKFRRVVRRDVMLELPSGKSLRVPLKAFTESDSEYIAEQRKNR